ncbi:MAG TPA: hypothetical protein VJ955_05970 [Desulfuromonadales bacterium]|nr:hypothetical protein [Desulfuromonadales bacterium]
MNKFVKVLFALGLTVLMATPALAEFSVYGSVRFDTFYTGTKAATGTTYADGKDTHNTWDWGQAVNSRLGAKFANGALSGQVELGTEGANNGNTVYTRLMYGVYKFDGGNLLVGQTYTPYTFFSEQVVDGDNGFIGYGALYDSRQPMVKVTLDNGLYLALISPKDGAIVTGTSTTTVTVGTDANGNPVTNDVTSDVTGSTKTFLPKIALGYDGAFGNVKAGGGVAYNGFTEKDAATGFSKTISSYIAYLHGAIDLNPITLTATAHYGQNLGNFGISGRESSVAIYENGTLKDSHSYGGFFQVGYKVSETVKANAGIGYVHDDNDTYVKADQAMSYFVNAPIQIVKGFHVVPEFTYYDYMKNINDVKQGNKWEVGAKWQIDF